MRLAGIGAEYDLVVGADRQMLQLPPRERPEGARERLDVREDLSPVDIQRREHLFTLRCASCGPVKIVYDSQDVRKGHAASGWPTRDSDRDAVNEPLELQQSGFRAAQWEASDNPKLRMFDPDPAGLVSHEFPAVAESATAVHRFGSSRSAGDRARPAAMARSARVEAA